MQGRIKRKGRGKGKMKKPYKPEKNKLIEKELSENTDGLNNSDLENNKIWLKFYSVINPVNKSILINICKVRCLSSWEIFDFG